MSISVLVSVLVSVSALVLVSMLVSVSALVLVSMLVSVSVLSLGLNTSVSFGGRQRSAECSNHSCSSRVASCLLRSLVLVLVSILVLVSVLV